MGPFAWDGPMSTVVAASDMARDVLALYGLITWICVAIGTLVFAVLGYVLVRFRERPGAPLPAQSHGRPWLEIAWTLGPAIVLLVIAVPTIQVIFRTQTLATPRDALEVVVRGYQWWWEFSYPSLGVVTANELVVPAGRRVVFRLEGPDVIHSFWVPKFGGKRDVVPGRANTMTLMPSSAGDFWGQCAEFCGASHANMGMRVVVHAPERFDAWVRAQRAPAVEPAGEPATTGKALFAASACVGCHTVRGVSAGTLGPDLTHFGSRTTLGAGMLPNTPQNLVAWVRDAPALKPGAKMPPFRLTDEQARALAAYLLALQ
ncbi:MAG: cytochrome c oxidase subunit II [Candidatus Rokubacteria bacterium]|nr:cytochrome c oxidase subunit II [Candidatus Rokubacteria bacterium]